MAAVFLWMVITLAVGFGIYYLIKTTANWAANRFGKAGEEIHGWTGLLLAAVAVVVAISPIYYEFPDCGTSQVVTFENGVVVVHPFGTFVWEGGEYSNMPLKRYVDERPLVHSVTIRTQNPKVRKISFSAAGLISDPQQFYRLPERRRNSSGEVNNLLNKLVKNQLYEFTQTQSASLEQFYNPLRSDQQSAFNQLLEIWVNERLAKDGVAITAKGFSIDAS